MTKLAQIIHIGVNTFRAQGAFKLQIQKRLRSADASIYFLFIAAIFGIFLVFITPPLSGFDETTHFRAVVYYAEGSHSTSDKNSPIKGIYTDSETADFINFTGRTQAEHNVNAGITKMAWRNDGHTPSLTTSDMGGAAVYSQIAYAPSLTTVWLVRLLHAPILFQIWFARLSSLLMYVILVYMAIRILPFGKWALFVIGLLPMTLFQAATITVDGLLNGLVFLYVSLVIAFVAKKIDLQKTKKYTLLLIAANILMCLTKPTYIVLALLMFFIPVDYFKTNMRKWVFTLSGIAIVLIPALLWNMHIKDVALKVGQGYGHGVVDYGSQLSFILHHPLFMFRVAFETIVNFGYNYYSQIIGVFDPEFHALPFLLGVPIAVVFFMALFQDKSLVITMPRTFRFVSAGMLVLICAVIAATFYLTYSPVGSSAIFGIQGRYFTPLLILLLPIFAFKNIELKVYNPVKFYVPVMVVSLMVTIIQIPYGIYVLHYM